ASAATGGGLQEGGRPQVRGGRAEVDAGVNGAEGGTLEAEAASRFLLQDPILCDLRDVWPGTDGSALRQVAHRRQIGVLPLEGDDVGASGEVTNGCDVSERRNDVLVGHLSGGSLLVGGED